MLHSHKHIPECRFLCRARYRRLNSSRPVLSLYSCCRRPICHATALCYLSWCCSLFYYSFISYRCCRGHHADRDRGDRSLTPGKSFKLIRCTVTPVFCHFAMCWRNSSRCFNIPKNPEWNVLSAPIPPLLYKKNYKSKQKERNHLTMTVVPRSPRTDTGVPERHKN